jgi:hypothetical protein
VNSERISEACIFEPGSDLKAVSENLYLLLQQLMPDPTLQDFCLVGGTGLALQLDHRASEDIDLFSIRSFDSQKLCFHLEQKFKAYSVIHEPDTARVMIDGIKVEAISHQYPMLEDTLLVDGIRIAGLKDLAAFKLNAVSGRGSKKDFWDIDALLDYFSLSDLVNCFRQKYQAANLWHLTKALSFFDDADNEQIEIRDFRGRTWAAVKERIQREVLQAGLI